MIRSPFALTLPRLWAAGLVLTGLALCPSLRAQSLSGGTLSLGGSNTYTGGSTISANIGNLQLPPQNTSVTVLGITPINTTTTFGSGLTFVNTGALTTSGGNFSGNATVTSGTFNISVGGGTVVLKSSTGGSALTVTSKDGTLVYTSTGSPAATDAGITPVATPAPTPLPVPWRGTYRSVLSLGTSSTGAAIFQAYTGGIRRFSADPDGAVVTGDFTLYQSATGKLTGSVRWSDTGLTQAVTGKRDLQTGRGDFIQRGADGAPAAGAMRVPFNSSKDGSLLTGGAMADNGESLAVRLTAGQ